MTPQEKAIAFAAELKKLLKQAKLWASNKNLKFLNIRFNFEAKEEEYEWEPIKYENQTTDENI